MDIAASTAWEASAARFRRGRELLWLPDSEEGLAPGRRVPGENTEPGDAPVVLERMKGRPTKISIKCRVSLRWALERKRGEEGVGFCTSPGRVDHQVRKLWQMSIIRSK